MGAGLRTWAAALLLLSGWLLAGPARATHIVGGEMELVHRSGENYTLLVNLYFDAYNGSPSALDADLTASIFEKASNQRMANVLLPLVSNTFVNYTNPACARPTLSTRKLVYSKDIVLAANTYNSIQGYYAAVERCCRNNAISNILNPGGSGQAFYLEFPGVVRRGLAFYDSTPRIFPPLADYACRGELFYYNFGGTDADGDSLVYELATPLNGHADGAVPKPAAAAPAPYALVDWSAGLSTANQIPGAPTLDIDRRSGRLTVRPLDLGLFVFGVRCEEYRGGQKIGETRRDFQLMVLNCPINAAPSLVLLPAPTGPVAYRPGRDTLRLVPGGNRCLRLRFTDPDPTSRLTVSVAPVNFGGLLPTFTTATSGTVRSPGMPDTLTATLCFPECMNSRGRVFYADVTVGDNGCSLPRLTTVRVAFTAVPPPNGPPALVSTAGPALPLRVRVGDLVTFDLTGTDPDSDPLTLAMTGRGFDPAALGATLSQSTVGGQQRGRFSWRVDCRAITPALREFQFVASAAPCGERQVASLVVPIVVEYANTAPVLTSTLPPLPATGAAPAEVILRLGQRYTATLAGTDADFDNLSLTAIAEFNLTEAGMRFTPRNGTGSAAGTFEWDVSCAAVGLRRDLDVTFRLADATCLPLPQTRTVRFKVQRPESPTLKLYNVITPNRDGLNDEFRLPELPADFCDERFESLKIFSRWGQQVYETTDRDFRWAGLGNGSIYYYLVAFTDGRKYRGWLEVVP